ncbi:hypothetical protein L3Y34_005287 [Caenorhabditis briggsae]|uniref:Uncharacterized protein n=1 Tax=Caenorhabditis briggsae TaxID=6238 RepID=A0AAE9D6S9_CAEBR|nr:hypothetical protein L3Y34_005287 [Caenorhabditis briggsae]
MTQFLCANCQAVEKFMTENQEALHAHSVDGIFSNSKQSVIRLPEKFFAQSAKLAASRAMCSHMSVVLSGSDQLEITSFEHFIDQSFLK